jgi:glutamate-1-semialdehyde 2,1-aminomutase
MFGPEPKSGTQAHDAMDFELERFMHLYAMNRGVLLTPFHNMALMCPQTKSEDVDQHTKIFRKHSENSSPRQRGRPMSDDQ